MVSVHPFLKAFTLTTSIYSTMLLLYIIARIVFNEVEIMAPFIEGVPYFSILNLALISLVAAVAGSILYLFLDGRLKR